MFFTISVYTIFVFSTRAREKTPKILPKRAVGQLGANADDGHVAAREGTLFAVAEKEITSAGGAEVADEDVMRAQAGVLKLGAVGFTKVEDNVFRGRLMAGRGHVEPLEGVGLVPRAKLVEPIRGAGKLGSELGGDFSADFVAAVPNGRA
jgi:hypothetical protein